MKDKIYKISCEVSSRERIFTFIYFQPAFDIRIAFRLMKERLKHYYGWKYLSLNYWCRVDISDYFHFKIN